MLGSDDFRSERGHRASDPSLEEMLRRARDACLGGTLDTTSVDAPRFTPFPTTESRAAFRGRWRDCALLVIGVLLGALVTCMAVRVGALASGVSEQQLTPVQSTPSSATPISAVPTDAPLPTPTDTPVPTPTDMSTDTRYPDPPPPTADDIVSLAQHFYDNESLFAGIYVMMNGPKVQVQSQGETQITVCIAYDYASVASSDTVVGNDTRTFTLCPDSIGTWHVAAIGDAASCSLS